MYRATFDYDGDILKSLLFDDFNLANEWLINEFCGLQEVVEDTDKLIEYRCELHDFEGRYKLVGYIENDDLKA